MLTLFITFIIFDSLSVNPSSLDSIKKDLLKPIISITTLASLDEDVQNKTDLNQTNEGLFKQFLNKFTITGNVIQEENNAIEIGYWKLDKTFNGISDKVIIPDSENFTFTNGFSVLVILNPDILEREAEIFGQWGDLKDSAWSVSLYNGKPRMKTHGNEPGTSTLFQYENSLSSEEFSHLVFVYSGGDSGTNAYIYLNGKLVKEGTLDRIPRDSPLDARIGMADGDEPRFFKGKINEIRVWKGVLTSDEILKIYKNENGN